ncbi:hypothetical protein Y032_0501g2596 [Ancylostoma ceylanicum]|uniref:N-alpha-acetyltransferase 60 n=1 Tax=Ancylostoma ceylanicum TaxID=53326 RepID=A0A016WVX6_9BILA|nr:hypothetical protein Y032_0501g2596 [Ancylostoma ceylanicum]
MPIPSSDGEEDLLLRDGGSIVHSLVLRSLTHDDVPAIKALCAASFPIQYPECWFEEVVSGALISVGLFDDEQLVAMMVAETKTILHCNPEDRDIVADTGAHVVYMLSLAVAHPYRRLGLASRLLRHLLDSVVDNPPYPKAVFLHVLSTNTAAIKFYKSNGFVHHTTLLNYYRLKSEYGDGCTYVLYTNGSRPPFSLNDICRSVGTALCFPIKALCRTLFY